MATRQSDHLIHFETLEKTNRSQTVEHWKKLYLEFAPQTTIHGVKEFTANDHINMKILWAFLITGCMIGMGFGTFQIIAQYYQSPTTSSVEHITPKKFPVIEFCPRHWVNCTAAQHYYNINPDQIQLLKWLSWYNFDYYKMSKYGRNISIADAQSSLLEILRSNVYGFKNLTQIYQLVSLLPTGNYGIIQQKANTKADIKKSSVAKGVCYTIDFIADEMKTGDVMQYFMMVNKIQYQMNSDWTCVSNLTINYPTLSDEQFDTVAIGADAISDYSENNYAIIPGQSLSFKIRTTQHQFPKTHSANNCVMKENYIQLNCLNACTAILVNKTFGCYFYFGDNAIHPPTRPDGQSTDWERYCLLSSNFTTINDIIQHRSVNYADPDYVACQLSCKIPCNQTTYEPIILSLGADNGESSGKQVTTMERSSQGQIQSKHVPTFEFEYRNYFSSIEISESSAYQWPSMMGNIGGMISLWTGCSFISLCHIVYHFFLRQICPKPKTISRLSRTVSDNMLNRSRRSSLSSIRSFKLKNRDSMTRGNIVNLSNYYGDSTHNDTDIDSFNNKNFEDTPRADIDLEAGNKKTKIKHSDTLREKLIGTIRRIKKNRHESDDDSSVPEIPIQIGYVGRRKTSYITPAEEIHTSGYDNISFEVEEDISNKRPSSVAQQRTSESKESQSNIYSCSPDSSDSRIQSIRGSKISNHTISSPNTEGTLKIINQDAPKETKEAILELNDKSIQADGRQNLSEQRKEPKSKTECESITPVSFHLSKSGDETDDSETYGLPPMIIDPMKLMEQNRQSSNELAARQSSSSSKSLPSKSDEQYVGRRKTYQMNPQEQIKISGYDNVSFESDEDISKKRQCSGAKKFKSDSKKSSQANFHSSSPNSSDSSLQSNNCSKSSSHKTPSPSLEVTSKTINHDATNEGILEALNEAVVQADEQHDIPAHPTESKSKTECEPSTPVILNLSKSGDDTDDLETYGLPSMIMDPMKHLDLNRQRSNELAARRRSSNSNSVTSKSHERVHRRSTSRIKLPRRQRGRTSLPITKIPK